MPPSKPTIPDHYVYAGFALVSGLLWVIVWSLNQLLMGSTAIASGIHLIFLPAGFRLLLILLFGVWGAIGIFIFEPLLFLEAFGSGSGPEVIVSSLISAFSPLLMVILFCRGAGIQRSLTDLRPLHLPLLSLCLSLFTPLLFNIFFVLSGIHPLGTFMTDYSGMATGDFLGCTIVIGTVMVVANAVRRRAA